MSLRLRESEIDCFNPLRIDNENPKKELEELIRKSLLYNNSIFILF
jgi:hypothetical protein